MELTLEMIYTTVLEKYKLSLNCICTHINPCAYFYITHLVFISVHQILLSVQSCCEQLDILD